MGHPILYTFYEAGCGLLRDKITASLVVAGVTLPMWHALLKTASDNAALLTPIAFLTVALLKVWQEWPSAEKRASLVARLAPAATKLKSWAFVAVALLTLGAVFLFVSKSSAKADVGYRPAVAEVAGRKRKADDDAGDEGEADAADPGEPGAPPWFWTAKALTGTQEKLPNGRANPEVKAMFAAVDGFDPKTVDCRNTAWCAVFVNFILAQKGIAGTRSAMARSFSRSRNFTKLEAPRIGCIVVMWRGQSDDGQSGHVGFYAGDGGPRYNNVLGGNQGDAVSIAKFPKSRVIGYYWPRGKWQSRTNQGSAVAATATAAGAGAIGVSELADEKPNLPVEAIRETLERVQEPLANSGHPKAMKLAVMIGLALLVLGVAGAAYALYRRNKDRNNGF